MSLHSAIIPFASGYLGLVTVRDDGDAYTLVSAETLPVGHKQDLPGTIVRWGKEMPRFRYEASDAELAATAKLVASRVSEDTVLSLEEKADSIAGRLVSALVELLPDARRRHSMSIKRTEEAEEQARRIRGWNATGPGKRLLERTAALLFEADAETDLVPALEASIQDAPSIPAPSLPSEPSPTGSWASIAARGRETIAEAMPEAFVPEPETQVEVPKPQIAETSIHQAPEDNHVAQPDSPQSPGASRTEANEFNPNHIAGIDPGSGWIGLVIAEGQELPLRVILRQVIPVGKTIKLDKPRKTKKRDGTPYEVTREMVFTEELVDAAADTVAELLLSHGVSRVILEHLFEAPGTLSVATHLIRTMQVATTIRERVARLGIKVERVRAATWRGKVAGRGKGGTGKERIPEAVKAGYTQWPEKSNDHERDAAGLAMYGVLIAQVEREKTAAPEKEKPAIAAMKRRVRTDSNRERKKEATKQKRSDAGCVCAGKRHRSGCPLWTEPKERRLDKRLRQQGKAT